MAEVSIYNLKEELVVFLRNQDIISISDRGVTTSQDTGTFSAAATHTLATNPTLVKNVRDITVASNPLTFGDDYTVNYSTGVITFTVAQTGAYVINYDQGATDRIFPDYPQPGLKMTSFPRIAVDIISGDTAEFEIGAATDQTSYVLSIVCYDRSQSNVEAMIAAVRSSIRSNKKTFFYSPLVGLVGMGPMLPSPFGENKIMQRNQDITVRFIFEQ